MTASEDDAELLAALARERDPKPGQWRMLQQRRRELLAGSRAREMTSQTALFEHEHPNDFGRTRPPAQNFTGTAHQKGTA